VSYKGVVRRTDVATAVDAAAYACGRSPGTFSAVERVLRELALVRPSWRPRSVLDIGAGVGSAAWAAVAVFDSITDVTLLERSEQMVALGRRVAAAGATALRDAAWVCGDAMDTPDSPPDLVIASYVLGELPDAVRAEATSRWHDVASAELVILEPGSKDGFEIVRRARDRLIALGATITAPCPHDGTCPMQGGDWCHFGVRVQRSRLQRRVKSGDRGFEDEKYSYVVASKQSPAERSSRILRRPERRGGHIRLRLCTDVGAEDIVIAKRDAERYRWARKAEWGDTFDGSSGR
jgi:ribosomal protein RSM22 (predicted rRNA methylase)